MKDRFVQQCAWEDEGIHAGRQGFTREECPYDRTTDNDAWNFWVYGCENVIGEREHIKRGRYLVFTTGGVGRPDLDPCDFNDPTAGTPLVDAIINGWWEPRYHTKAEALTMLVEQKKT